MHQAPLSMEFFRQEYWSGLPFSTLGDLPDPQREPTSLVSMCIGRQGLYQLCQPRMSENTKDLSVSVLRISLSVMPSPTVPTATEGRVSVSVAEQHCKM